MEPTTQSRPFDLHWMYESLGSVYCALILSTGLVVFLGACFLVLRRRRPAIVAAYLVFIPIPLLIGIFSAVHRFIIMHAVIANYNWEPTSQEVARGISVYLFPILAGFVVVAPSYLVVAVGLLVSLLRTSSAK